MFSRLSRERPYWDHGPEASQAPARPEPAWQVSPAMAAGVTDRLWSVGDMVKVLEEWELENGNERR
jgi:hypothetical protein